MRPQKGTESTKSIRTIICAFCAFSSIIYLHSPFLRGSSLVSDPQPQASPSPSPPPSPSPSPTPVTGLHQWGAVTLFHGLPSDRVRAITQAPDGAMWFGTESGLARFDGRRTETINDPALPAGRVLALQTDQDGAMWVGTESGAARFSGGVFERIKDTATQAVSAIVIADGAAYMSTEQGNVYESRARSDTALETRAVLSEPLQNADRERPGPLPITSINRANNRLFI